MNKYFEQFQRVATTEQLKRFRDAYAKCQSIPWRELAVMADSEIIYRELEGEA